MVELEKPPPPSFRGAVRMALLIMAAMLGHAAVANAQPTPDTQARQETRGPPTSGPVITQEAADRVRGLFAPYEMGDHLAPGWQWTRLSIEATYFVVHVEGPDDSRILVTFSARSTGKGEAPPPDPTSVARGGGALETGSNIEPDLGPQSDVDADAELISNVSDIARTTDADRSFVGQTASFSYESEETTPEGRDVALLLIGALASNDDGTFWKELAPPASAESGHDRPPHDELTRFEGPRNAPLPPSSPVPFLTTLTLYALLAMALLLAVLDRRARLPFERAPRAGWPGKESWLLGLVIAGLLVIFAPSPHVQADTLRDLALAVECASGGFCVGAPTSFRPLDQGVGWTRLLAFLSTLGGPPSLLRAIGLIFPLSITVNALASVLFHNEMRRWFDRAVALRATFLFVAALVYFTEFPTQNNPTFAALPMVAYFAGIVLLVAERRTRWALLATVSLAILLETHPFNATLLPPLLFIAACCAARPAQAVALAVVVPSWSMWLLGRNTLLVNVTALHEMGVLIPGIVVTGLFVIAGVISRDSIASFSLRKRVGVVVLGAIVATLVIPAILAVVFRRGLAPPYVLSAMVGLPVLAAPYIHRALSAGPSLRRHLLGKGLIPMAIFAVWNETKPIASISYSEISPLTQAIHDLGNNWAYVDAVLSGRESQFPAPLTWPGEPPPPRAIRRDSKRLLLTSQTTWNSSETDEGWTGETFGRGMLLLFSPLDRWVESARPEAASARPEEELEATAGQTSAPVIRHLSIRSRTEEEPSDRHVTLVASQPHRWHIVDVQGVEFTGELPSQEVTLVQEEPSPGVLVIEYAGVSHDDVPTPVLFETTPDEHQIRGFLRHARPGSYISTG